MATSYADYDDYLLATGDDESDEERVELMLEELSADLRAECGIPSDRALKGDAAIVARHLVVDAAKAALVTPTMDGFGGDLDGVRQASFTVDGFTKSVTLATGRAYFDRDRLARLRRLVGRGARAGMVYPYGWG